MTKLMFHAKLLIPWSCALMLVGSAFADDSAQGSVEPPPLPPAAAADSAGTAAADSAGLLGSAPIAHPTKAVCRVCEAKGSGHGKEDVVAWRTHEGYTYYFCSEDCAAAFDANPQAFVTPRFPRPAPSAAVRTLDGETVTLDSLRGDVTLVDFWATWCKPCVKTMPKIQKLHDQLSARGFRAIGISIDEHGDLNVHEFVEKNKLTYPIVIDNETTPAWEAFYVVTVPAMYLIDREGQIVAQWSGEANWKQVEESVRMQLAAVSR